MSKAALNIKAVEYIKNNKIFFNKHVYEKPCKL